MIEMGFMGVTTAIIGIFIILSTIKENAYLNGSEKFLTKIREELKFLLIAEIGVLTIMVLLNLDVIG